MSGSQYLINDVLDMKKDRNHPKKCKRPIASGRLNPKFALIASLFMVMITMLVSTVFNIQFMLSLAGYFVLTLIYSMYLKQFALVDIIVIALGFVIRAGASAFAINLFDISPWLIICAFLMAIFLALGKRRSELSSLGNKAKEHRKSLEFYSVESLDQMMNITAGILITAYSLYTFQNANSYMMLTLPLIIYSLFKYILLVHKNNVGSEVEIIFKDRGICGAILLWISLVIFILLL